MVKHNSTRVDEGRKCCTLLAIEAKARTVVGRVEKSLLSNHGSEIRLGKEKKKQNSAKIIHEMGKNKRKK